MAHSRVASFPRDAVVAKTHAARLDGDFGIDWNLQRSIGESTYV